MTYQYQVWRCRRMHGYMILISSVGYSVHTVYAEHVQHATNEAQATVVALRRMARIERGLPPVLAGELVG
jgi:hypothetical protein